MGPTRDCSCQPKKMQALSPVMEFFEPFVADACRWSDIKLGFEKEELKGPFLQCVKLNGLFLALALFVNYIVTPIGRYLFVSGEDTFWQNYIVPLCFFLSSTVVFICMFALYMPLLWMNGRYYMEISKAMEKRIRKKVVEKPTREDPGLSSVVANMVWELILLLVFVGLVLNIISLIPVIGTPLYFIYSCWGTSYYCFNYKWQLKYPQWSVNNRLFYFESNWLYFVGFGTPLTLILWPMSVFVSLGTYAVLFPVFVAMAQISSPKRVISPYLPGRVAIFKEARWIVDPLVSFAGGMIPVILEQFSRPKEK